MFTEEFKSMINELESEGAPKSMIAIMELLEAIKNSPEFSEAVKAETFRINNTP